LEYVNDLTPYELPGQKIESWARDVLQVYPNIDLEMISFMILCFKTEQLIWDDRKGIQNIFNGLRRIEKTDNGYKLIRLIY